MLTQLKETLTANGSTADFLQVCGYYTICISGTWDGATLTLYRKDKDDLTAIDKLKEYTEGTISYSGECELGFSESIDYLYYVTLSNAGASTSLTVKLSYGNVIC